MPEIVGLAYLAACPGSQQTTDSLHSNRTWPGRAGFSSDRMAVGRLNWIVVTHFPACLLTSPMQNSNYGYKGSRFAIYAVGPRGALGSSAVFSGANTTSPQAEGAD